MWQYLEFSHLKQEVVLEAPSFFIVFQTLRFSPGDPSSSIVAISWQVHGSGSQKMNATIGSMYGILIYLHSLTSGCNVGSMYGIFTNIYHTLKPNVGD